MSYYSAISDIIKLFFVLLLFPIYSLAITEPFMDVELTFDLSPHIIGLLSGENRCQVSVREKPLEEFSLEEGVHGSNKKFYYYMHQNFCKDIRELFNSASVPSAKSMWKILHSYRICFRGWPEMLESISYFEKLFQRMYNRECLTQGIFILDSIPNWILCTQFMRNNAPPKFHEIPYQMAVRIEQPANKKYANSSVVREQYCDLELVEPLSYLLTAQVQKHYDGNEEITYEVPIMTDCYPPDFGNTLIKAFNQNSRENEHHILLIIPEVFAQSSVDLHEENTVVIKVHAEHDDHAEYALEDIKLPIVVEESHKSPVAIAKAEKETEFMDVETLDSGLGLDEINKEMMQKAMASMTLSSISENKKEFIEHVAAIKNITWWNNPPTLLQSHTQKIGGVLLTIHIASVNFKAKSAMVKSPEHIQEIRPLSVPSF